MMGKLLLNDGVQVGTDSTRVSHKSDPSLVDEEWQPCLQHVTLLNPFPLGAQPDRLDEFGALTIQMETLTSKRSRTTIVMNS